MCTRLFGSCSIPARLTFAIALAGCGRLSDRPDIDDFAADAQAEAASDAGWIDAGLSDAGSSDACAGTSVTFKMIGWRPDGAPPQYCTSCGWLTILSGGRQVEDLTAWCKVDCNGCSQRICPPVIACPNVSLPIEGNTTTWDGTLFESGSCGSGTVCSELTCAKPGSHWIARMCATPGATDGGLACVGMGPQNCVDVPFDYPAPDPVVGTLYPLR